MPGLMMPLKACKMTSHQRLRANDCEDLRAVTPLIWEHVNPYGRFDLDMETRLDLSPNGPW
jgi:hypothetical protein